MLETSRYITGSITGYNVIGNPSAFESAAGSRVAFVWGAAGQRLPFPDATFDSVTSLNILEHVRDLEV